MGYEVNSFPIKQGKVNMTSGSLGRTVLCVADGDILVTWSDGTTSTVSLVVGNAIDLRNAVSATITSGTYHSS